MKSSISIVVPAYNEQETIRASALAVVAALKNRFDSYEVIIVDDASQDDTGRVADELAASHPNIRVVHHERNQGMGKGLLTGFQLATKEYVGSFPGDFGLTAESFGEMLELVGQADMVVYYLANSDYRARYRTVLSVMFTKLMNALFGLRHKYYNGHAIYRRDILSGIKHTAFGHVFLAETLVRLTKAGYSYVEIGTLQNRRQFGRDKAISLRNVIGVIKAIASLKWDLRAKKK
jgi:glycosyltransferase involved in cell wall biosynthesis